MKLAKDFFKKYITLFKEKTEETKEFIILKKRAIKKKQNQI